MILHEPGRRDFASDNYSGVHAEVIAALTDANGGHVGSYGADPYTARLQEVVAGHFGERAEAFPVFNGTGANVLALQAVLPRWGAVICAHGAHINTDENGAPERVGGLKLLPVRTRNGKLTPELLAEEAWGQGDEHRAQPLAVSITQATEVGTVYSVEELQKLGSAARRAGLLVHMDGARLANAAAHLGVGLGALSTDVGVDIISLGGTKNGLLGAEVIVVVDRDRIDGLVYLRKMNMQLASKMRFLSAQLVALYSSDLWLRSAAHANAMAARLAAGLGSVPGVRITQEVEANGVFAILPEGMAPLLRARFSFYDWDHRSGEVRLMCSFDTTDEDVDELIEAARTM